MGMGNGHWFGPGPEPDELPPASDLVDIDGLIEHAKTHHDIRIFKDGFLHITLLGDGPYRYTFDGIRRWQLSQFDKWVNNWTRKPKSIGYRFREPRWKSGCW